MAGRKQGAGVEIAIGATILAAIVLLLMMILIWGNSSTFLSKHYWVVVLMNNVGGLREGAPVKIGGVQIGRVSTIQLQSGSNDLEIALSIEESRNLPAGSTAKISTAGLVGDAFMEILPGKSIESLRHASTIAEADHITSHPGTDFSELLVQVNSLGEKLNLLFAFVNEILGEEDFRKNIKSIAANLDSATYEANLVLQRSQRVVDNIERASHNVAILSDSVKTSVETAAAKATEIAGQTAAIADKVAGIVDEAKDALRNLDGGITDVRAAVNRTIGDPEVARDLSAMVGNISRITGTIDAKRPDLDALIANMNAVAGDFKNAAFRISAITEGVEPEKIAAAANSLSGAIASVAEAVEKIKNDPVLALSINKAADRIVKMKFDEMSKVPQFKASDQALQEIQRWTRDAVNRGYHIDPSYSRERRPYAMDQ